MATNEETSRGSLQIFVEKLNSAGGVSLSNNYDVEFYWNKNNSASLIKQLKEKANMKIDGGALDTNDYKAFSITSMCDEAQLPNVQAMTGTVTGRYMGEGQINYPHTKMYSDFQLSWLSDANMSSLKFLNAWYSFIFQEFDGNGQKIFSSNQTNLDLGKLKQESRSKNQVSRSKRVRLNFPDAYLADIVITKTERGKNAPNSRASIAYTMIDCFPYSIDAVPLSYGASQITKVTANFYYSRYTYSMNDISNFPG